MFNNNNNNNSNGSERLGKAMYSTVELTRRVSCVSSFDNERREDKDKDKIAYERTPQRTSMKESTLPVDGALETIH
jgi:hypothetical protein